MEILSIGNSVLNLFFPERCLNCDQVIAPGNPLCVRCTADLPFTHWKPGKSNLAYQKLKPICNIQWAHSLLVFRHDNVTRKLLHYLKYHGHLNIGRLLAEKTSSMIELSDFQGIIPIPVHPAKLKKRGYNQVIPYAETLADNAGIPLLVDFLHRVENNPSQVFKNREKRLNSIQNAFDIRHQTLEGNYLLVDDVLTTGATLSTCVNLIRSKTKAKFAVMTMACTV